MIYLLIFSFKIIENTLSTIRIIILANNNKKLAAILQGIISLIWVISTSLVVIDFNKGIGKIIAFTFGSLIGSYLGSILEEKIAIGNILLTIKIRKEKTKKVLNILKLYNTFTIKNDNYNQTPKPIAAIPRINPAIQKHFTISVSLYPFFSK